MPIAVRCAMPCAALTLLATAYPAAALPDYYDAWVKRYPTSTIPQRMQAAAGSVCYTCHTPPSVSEEGTCYRIDLRSRLHQGQTIEQALAAVEWLDSDNDGVPNLVEILAARTDLPGQVGYHPGLVGPTGVSPCSSTPMVPVSNQNETPAWCYANCDQSTVAPTLNVNDFLCFQSAFASGSAYANCDGSTAEPILNVNDFLCFQSQFAAGCP